MRIWFCLLIVVVARAALAPAAVAGDYEYVVSACSDGEHVAPLDGWVGSPPGAAVDACASGGGMGYDLGPALSAARWTVMTPSGSSIRNISVYWPRRAGGQPVEILAQSGDVVLIHQGLTDVRDVNAIGLPVSGPAGAPLSLVLQCITSCSGPTWLRVSQVDLLLEDRVAPAVSLDPARGSLRFSDLGSGVERVELEVDGVMTASNVGGERCRRPFVHLTPCLPSGELPLAKDGLAPGEHSVFAKVVDASGRRAYLGPLILTVPAPSPAPVAVPVPRRAGVVIVDGAPARRVGYRPVKLAGVVRDVEGAPIAGAPIEVSTRVAGSSWKQLTTAAADAGGRFSVMLPRGPSRDVRLSYGGAARIVRLVVPAPVRLAVNHRTTRNGRTVTFTGRVPGAGSARGRITLQAWAGDRWIPFKTVALKRERFTDRYRFTDTTRTSRYRFRALVEQSADLPFASATSPIVSVLVRGRR